MMTGRRAFAVGIASGLVVLWLESLFFLASELYGWTGAYVVNGWAMLLTGLVAFVIGFYAMVKRGRRALER